MNNDEKFYLVDTNTLINNPYIVKEYNSVITSHVLREIEHLELTRKSDKQLQYEIRQTKSVLDENEHIRIDLKDYKFTLTDEWDKSYVDNILIQACVDNNYGLITNDKLLREKAQFYNIEIIKPTQQKEYVENKGFKIVDIDEESHIENLISLNNHNVYNLIVNEYAIINRKSDGELLDIVKWNGNETVSLKDSKGRLGQTISSEYFGEISPKDEFQVMAIDSILNHQVTILRGKAGSGKSLLALTTAWQLVENEGYKLVIFCNPVEAKGSASMGYYKGTKLEKILQNIGTLVSKFGDEFKIQEFIEEGKLELQTFNNLRGYETGNGKVIVWCIETQNLDTNLLKMGLQRINEDTKIILDGDFHAQVDMDLYQYDNGMKRASEVLRGTELFGEIELQNVYRSKLAELVDAM